MTRRHAAVGAVLATGAIVVIILAGGPSRYSVTAEFNDVRGLVAGAQVRLAGVTVGTVDRIMLGRDGWPRVALSIDRDVQVHASARAAVRLASLSGEFNRYVSIVQGDGPPATTIPRNHTTSPVEVDEALSTFDPASRKALRSTLAGLRKTVAGQGPAIAATLQIAQTALAQVGGLSADVAGDGTALRTLLASTHTLATTLATRNPQLAAAVDNTQLLLHTLGRRASDLANGLGGLPLGLDEARSLLSRTQALVAPANRLLDSASPAVAQLPAAATELQTTLAAARPTLSRAADASNLAPAAARSLTPALHAAGPLLNVMIPVLTRLGPMLDQLRVRLPDAFSFFANWADFTSNYDANGHAARVGIVLPPAPTSVLSPSATGPGQLAPPYLRTPGSLEGQPWTDYWKSFVAGGKP
jgi:phospholipid/cholesterol/gamma-HCH transport system substrate-binding protein